MENFFTRYKNPLALMAVLFVQVIALATQIKRPDDPRASGAGGTRLIRVWTGTALTPVEHALVSTSHFFRNTWHNYVDLHNVRRQNQDLQAEVNRLRTEEVRYKQDSEQARRLQALLGFKQRFIGQTVAAQVVGTSGSEQSHLIYIDKGLHDGIKPDMAVITPDGIVGKVKEVGPLGSTVLLINDRDSGAGVILEKSRLQGTLHGTPQGETVVRYVMSDEKIDVGEAVITSGGDRIYPKGLPVGDVNTVAPDHDNDPFLMLTIRPAANLNKLEEVLVITRMAEETPSVASPAPTRAADILAERLPSIPRTPDKPKTAIPPAGGAASSASAGPGAKPPATGSNSPAGQTVAPKTTVPTAPKTAAASPAGPNNQAKPANQTSPATSARSGTNGAGQPDTASGKQSPAAGAKSGTNPGQLAAPGTSSMNPPQAAPPAARPGSPAGSTSEKPPR